MSKRALGYSGLTALLLALGAGAVVLYLRLKEEYLPQFQETDFLMHWVAKPGTNIDSGIVRHHSQRRGMFGGSSRSSDSPTIPSRAPTAFT